MSFGSMAKTLAQGEIPGVSIALAKNKLNEALQRVYDEGDWSWQTEVSGWYLRGLAASKGTVTCTPFSDQIVADAAATAAWALIVGRPFITEMQFRNPGYSLYNIIAYDDGTSADSPNPGFATLTLDRPWMEPVTGPGCPYMMYQAYFPVPVQDFTKFIEIRDTINSAPVSFWTYSQDDLSAIDPRRLMYGPTMPTFAVPCGVDKRPGSGTLGHVMYEIWPHNLSQYPYTFSYKRSGDLMVNPDDTPPYPISEALLMWRVKEILYQFKEAQKGENLDRGSGANWQFLAQAAASEYKEELAKIRRKDANLHRDFVTHPRRAGSIVSDGYSTNRSGYLNVGNFQR